MNGSFTTIQSKKYPPLLSPTTGQSLSPSYDREESKQQQQCGAYLTSPGSQATPTVLWPKNKVAPLSPESPSTKLKMALSAALEESKIERDKLVTTISTYEQQISKVSTERDQALAELEQLKAVLVSNIDYHEWLKSKYQEAEETERALFRSLNSGTVGLGGIPGMGGSVASTINSSTSSAPARPRTPTNHFTHASTNRSKPNTEHATTPSGVTHKSFLKQQQQQQWPSTTGGYTQMHIGELDDNDEKNLPAGVSRINLAHNKGNNNDSDSDSDDTLSIVSDASTIPPSANNKGSTPALPAAAMLQSALEASQRQLEQQILALIATQDRCCKEINELAEDLDKANAENQALRDRLAKVTSDAEKARRDLAQRDREVDSLLSSHRLLSEENVKLQLSWQESRREADAAKTALRNKEEENTRLKQRIEALEQDTRKYLIEIAAHERQALQLGRSLSMIQRQLEQQSQLEKEDLMRQIATSSAKLEEQQRQQQQQHQRPMYHSRNQATLPPESARSSVLGLYSPPPAPSSSAFAVGMEQQQQQQTAPSSSPINNNSSTVMLTSPSKFKRVDDEYLPITNTNTNRIINAER